ncbi:hypothetical protein [Mesorhizobium sp. WSM3224]|uniref:hypothetical protein n=1 Tax=Mesorhizobium sp. WSM3224 TaxID=1040986 RepID=UPI001AEC4D0C|nr:hypothetical protein [Mesorhizobium sp. WSM3224]
MAYLAFACSIAIACAGAAAGGQHGGGHDGGGNHGGDGGHDPGSHNDEGHNGSPHKGLGDPGDPTSDPPSDDDGISTITTGAVAPTTAVAPSADGGGSLDLPPALQPPEDNIIPPAVNPIEAAPGVPDDVVGACHDAIEQAAAPFGAASVRVVSAGSMHQLSRHTISAPVQVSIDYVRQDSVETRQASVGCKLNAKGSVIGLT